MFCKTCGDWISTVRFSIGHGELYLCRCGECWRIREIEHVGFRAIRIRIGEEKENERIEKQV